MEADLIPCKNDEVFSRNGFNADSKSSHRPSPFGVAGR